MSIRTVLRGAGRVLFTDSEHFNKDITGVTSLSDIKDWFCIRGRLRKSAEAGNRITYRLDNSAGYEFTLTVEG